MSKYEKYMNYIVDDLISKTKVGSYSIILPFHYPRYPPELIRRLPLPNIISGAFRRHVRNKFGTREGEIEIIWNKYRDRIKSLIKNNE